MAWSVNRLEFLLRPVSLTTREGCFQTTLEPKEEKVDIQDRLLRTESCGKQFDPFHTLTGNCNAIRPYRHR